jgi:hypothetical protein
MVLGGKENLAQIDQFLAIHMQCFDGSPAGRCKPNDIIRINAPSEMIAPFLLSRVEKWNQAACDRVDRPHLGEFMSIATLTGLREVLGDRQTTQYKGDDVFDRKGLRRKTLVAPTVFAKSACASLNHSPQFSRSILFGHGITRNQENESQVDPSLLSMLCRGIPPGWPVLSSAPRAAPPVYAEGLAIPRAHPR